MDSWGKYNDFMGALVDKPGLTGLLMENTPLDKASEADSKEDAAIFAHLFVAYGIIEEAHSLYFRKWIGEINWPQ